MGNGVLVFIVVVEAVVIIWLASKLKQYQKFEPMLNAQPETPAVAPARTALTRPAAPKSARRAPDDSDDDDDELLDMPGVEPETNIEEAKRVQLVMARCHYAEFYLEQLDDDYERGQFKHIVNSCMSTASGIADPFFKASALEPLIVLLDKAGWNAKRDKLMAEVDDEIIHQRIERALEENAAS
ncbi:hypothetical protein [Granulosicoccus antarcticus]|uniref:Uncharacterized protein n=1 Tax=Granulosicoccus antarcticus IMCC3135 TaxID=1192854 RepID=A0A2Z2NQ95_9GAMM|nr:hypothetical protein [Granulosicoccus antarcticus]ASJ70970.1 hypothetical protein IMCC3135_04285 [Granulosicoccus antarcticus IMCC3135]